MAGWGGGSTTKEERREFRERCVQESLGIPLEKLAYMSEDLLERVFECALDFSSEEIAHRQRVRAIEERILANSDA